MSDHRDLLREVFQCDACAAGLGCTKGAHGGGYLELPPTIGALGSAPLLFVGINPRLHLLT